MVSTFILFILPLILLCVFDVFPSSVRLTKNIYWLACIYVLAFSYTLVEYSGDFINYKDSFENIDSWKEYLAGSTLKGYAFEPGFLAFYFFVKNFITTDGNYGVTIITLTAGGGLLYFVPKYSRYFFIALVVYIAHFYWWLGIVLLRQMCAMIILFPVISCIKEEKWKKAIGLIALACLFHASALIFYVFLVMKKLRLFVRVRTIVVLIGVVFVLGYFDIIKIILSLIAGIIPRGDILMNYLLTGSGRSMNMLNYVEMLLVLFISLRYRIRLKEINKYTDMATEYLICSILLGGIFFHYEIGVRFMMYFNFYSYLILLPSFIDIFRKNIVNRWAYVFLLSCYMCVFLIRFVYITV